MNTVFIVGENSFLAKHLYVGIKTQKKYNVILLNHDNYDEVKSFVDDFSAYISSMYYYLFII